MKSHEFIKETIFLLDEQSFLKLKGLLIDDYISFGFVDEKLNNREVFAEKIYDYFHKVAIRSGRPFRKQIIRYIDDLNSLVNKRIVSPPKAKKGEEVIIPRARKYYELAAAVRDNADEISVSLLAEYTRIIMCLYTAIIKNEYNQIEDFNLSDEVVDIHEIIDSMKSEKGLLNHMRFDFTNPLSSDSCTFVIFSILMLMNESQRNAGGRND